MFYLYNIKIGKECQLSILKIQDILEIKGDIFLSRNLNMS